MHNIVLPSYMYITFHCYKQAYYSILDRLMTLENMNCHPVSYPCFSYITAKLQQQHTYSAANLLHNKSIRLTFKYH